MVAGRTHSYGGEDVTDVVLEPRVWRAPVRGHRRRRAGLGRASGVGAAGRFVLDWQIGEARGTEVEVTLPARGAGRASSSSTAAVGGGRARDNYERGWDVVLAPFVEQAS